MSVSVSCFVCGSRIFDLFVRNARDRMLGKKEMFFYEQCRKCRLVRQNPQISPEKLKAYYPSSSYYAYQEETSPGLFDRIRRYLLTRYYSPTLLSTLLTSVLPNVPAIPSWVKGGRMLDVGCGTGETIAQLWELGWNAYGLDIDKNAVSIANRRGLANVLYGSWQDMKKFPDNFFDAIRLYHVIEHLDDPVGCLRLVRKKLKDGGELLIGTPNAGSLIAKVFGNRWYNLDAPRHLYLFAPDNLTKLIKATGFDVLRIRFCSGGGILGSIQYLVGVLLLSRTWLVILVYPIEWVLDKIGLGDVFELRAQNVPA